MTDLLPDGFSRQLTSALKWRHVDCVDSTNHFLLDSRQPPNQLFSTNRQTQGRGRRGQTWTDNGDSALFSLSAAFPVATDISAWPIQVAITLADSLNRLLKTADNETAVCIKWPNDLYTPCLASRRNEWGKCGGILVESNVGSTPNGQGKVVTGIGLNLAPLPQIRQSDYPITHLPLTISQLFDDKTQLIAVLANRLWAAWQAFIKQPTVDPSLYQNWDLLHGKSLNATDVHHYTVTQGIGVGINANGHLLIQQADQTVALSAQQRIRFNSFDNEA